MKARLLIGGCCLAAAAGALRGDDALDRLDEALTGSAWHDQVRARLSGALELEGYRFSSPAPGLIYSDRDALLNPRLVLFLDVQAGPQVYFFAQSRLDRGFDPGDEGWQLRLDEYAVRLRPGPDGWFNLQLGKFATVVGNWVPRHQAWDNPFITAPLPYENLTGIWDVVAAGSGNTLLEWAHVRPSPYGGNDYADKTRQLPIIWGPSYATGAAVSGTIDRADYAVEFKNASLSSRPGSWDADQTQWQHPTVSGRLGYRPDQRWNLGFSASSGAYLLPAARPTLAAGTTLDDYREVVFGQDLGFAWHHLQLWAEVYEGRFAVPRVGTAETIAWYLEAKYKFTPQFFGAVRWNQQRFGDILDGTGRPVRWGRNVWRLDVAPTYRFTPHLQAKLQYSLQGEEGGPRPAASELAVQLVLRF